MVWQIFLGSISAITKNVLFCVTISLSLLEIKTEKSPLFLAGKKPVNLFKTFLARLHRNSLSFQVNLQKMLKYNQILCNK